MKRFALYLKIVPAACAVMFSLALHAGTDNLRCEYMTNPVGVDAAHPRLSWTLPGLKDKIRVVMSEDSLAVAGAVYGTKPGHSDRMRVYARPGYAGVCR